MKHKEMFLSIAEQLMDIGIALEKLARADIGIALDKLASDQTESALRTNPTMPTPENRQEAEAMGRELLLTEQPSEVEVVDPLKMLVRFRIDKPTWDLDGSAASDVFGIRRKTTQYLAERFAVPHALTREGSRGKHPRRIYSKAVCIAYMTQCYTRDTLPGFGIKLLNTQEAAALLNVTENTVSKWVKLGKLPSVIYGHRRYFFPADVSERLYKLTIENQLISEGVSNVVSG